MTIPEQLKRLLPWVPRCRMSSRREKASGKLLAAMQGHTGVILSVALADHALIAASGGLDGMVRLWEPETGRLLATLRGHTGLVRGVALSSDGRLVAGAGDDGTVRLWEEGSRRLTATMHEHAGVVSSVALSRDGRLLASGGDDGMLRIWDTGSGACLRRLRADRRYERLDITGLSGITGPGCRGAAPIPE